MARSEGAGRMNGAQTVPRVGDRYPLGMAAAALAALAALPEAMADGILAANGKILLERVKRCKNPIPPGR